MHKTIVSLTIIFVFSFSLVSLVFYSGTASGNQLSPEHTYQSEKNLSLNDIFPEKVKEIKKKQIYNFPNSSLLDFKNKKPIKKDELEKCALPIELKIAVLDLESNEIIYGQNKEEKSSIASITKLATALVFLDNNPGWDNYYEIKNSDIVKGGRMHIYLGEKVRMRDLFFLSLIASDNTAAKALANATGIENFPEAMNKKMQILGLRNTSFVDPVGIGMENISNAEEVIKLLKEALNKKEIKTAIFKKDYQFKTLRGRDVGVYSTDWLFRENNNNFIHLGGKTGYTESAGYCFAGIFKDEDGNEVITAVLNGPTINSRFKYSKDLVLWIFNSFIWS
jgi:D-alanyl-D-alanine endopeptidase (penicillin-binding protein 7)